MGTIVESLLKWLELLESVHHKAILSISFSHLFNSIVLKQGLIGLRLVLNSPWVWEWPWALDPLVSIAQVLGLKVCANKLLRGSQIAANIMEQLELMSSTCIWLNFSIIIGKTPFRLILKVVCDSQILLCNLTSFPDSSTNTCKGRRPVGQRPSASSRVRSREKGFLSLIP